MRSELHRHDIVLETELSPGLERVMDDRIQVQQVIPNLVMNGIEAMNAITDRSRVLRLSTQLQGNGAVLIGVADAGTGLDHAAKDRIFDAFFHNEVRRNGNGPVDLPFHRRSSWRSPVGVAKSTTRKHPSVYHAGCGQRVQQ
jgi:C4-dicarboxylate-specific signal transduction histidine kinase